ncbi:MAG TPA: DUF5947 family protein [Longimicrobiales bacterium]|nr:DUF5947 family protein [Longimicrobiales bacterium]
MRHPLDEERVFPLVATLRQLLEPAEAPRQRCELCDAPLSDEHGHLVDTRSRRLLCACRMCATAGGRYRAVPTRYVRLPRMALSLTDWEAIGIPVDLAFFFFNSDLGRVVACYPGPMGAAESLLPLDAWPALAERIPWIGTLAPDVEALLVRRAADEYAAFIVPIDVCYELGGRIRRAWTGFGGGATAQRAIDEFFATVLERSVESAPATPRSHGYGQERT